MAIWSRKPAQAPAAAYGQRTPHGANAARPSLNPAQWDLSSSGEAAVARRQEFARDTMPPEDYQGALQRAREPQ